MQNEKNQTKSLGEEGSEVSAQMGFKVKNERNKTMNYVISKIANASTSKNCPCSRYWLTEKYTIWSADPADAKRFNTKEEANNFKKTHRTGGSILQMK